PSARLLITSGGGCRWALRLIQSERAGIREGPSMWQLELKLVSIITFLSSALLAVGTVGIIYYFGLIEKDELWKFVVAALAVVPLVWSRTSFLWEQEKEQERELAPIRKEREEIREKIKSKEPNIFDTIQLNLNQLTEYYTINKSQG